MLGFNRRFFFLIRRRVWDVTFGGAGTPSGAADMCPLCCLEPCWPDADVLSYKKLCSNTWEWQLEEMFENTFWGGIEEERFACECRKESSIKSKNYPYLCKFYNFDTLRGPLIPGCFMTSCPFITCSFILLESSFRLQVLFTHLEVAWLVSFS